MKRLICAAAVITGTISFLYAQNPKFQLRAGAVSTSNSFTGASVELGLSKNKNGLALLYQGLDYCWCPCGDSTALPDPVAKVNQTAILYQRSISSKRNWRITAQTGIGLSQVNYRERTIPPVYKNGSLVSSEVYVSAHTGYKAFIPINLVTEFSPGRKNRQPDEKQPELWLGLRTGWQQVGNNGAVVIGLHLALTY